MALLALHHLMDGLAGVDRVGRTTREEPNVYELLFFCTTTVPMVIGLYGGNAIAHELGAAVGSIAFGLAGSALGAMLVARTEREIEARD